MLKSTGMLFSVMVGGIALAGNLYLFPSLVISAESEYTLQDARLPEPPEAVNKLVSSAMAASSVPQYVVFTRKSCAC